MSDLAKERGIYLKTRGVEVLGQMFVPRGQFRERVANGLQFGLRGHISALIGK